MRPKLDSFRESELPARQSQLGGEVERRVTGYRVWCELMIATQPSILRKIKKQNSEPRSVLEQVLCQKFSRRGAGAAEFEVHRSNVFSANSTPLREMFDFQRKWRRASFRNEKQVSARLLQCDTNPTSRTGWGRFARNNIADSRRICDSSGRASESICKKLRNSVVIIASQPFFKARQGGLTCLWSLGVYCR